jgi:hypothetical protein
MGNRAVIQPAGFAAGLYLHWNGGAESVSAFLRAARDLKVRDPVADPTYFLARLAQIVGNYFGGTLSVGVGPIKSLDVNNGDNGLYIVGADFAIVEHKHSHTTGYDDAREAAIYAEVMQANQPVFASGGTD